MNFATPRRRRPAESIVPMINVVFLLLVFFLMTATIAPPEPLEITPPGAEVGAEVQAGAVLLAAADGTLVFGAARGEAALVAATAAAREADGTLALRADAALEGAALARLLARIAAGGVERVDLVTIGGAGAVP